MFASAVLEAWFAAVRAGDLLAASTLLSRGVDIESSDQIGATALMRAVGLCQIDMIRFLIGRNADPNAPDFRGCTPTTAAVERTHAGTCAKPDRRPLDLLVAAGGRLGLREAVLLGDVDLARRLCDADPTLDISGDAHWSWHDTYLMVAVRYGSPAMVGFLLNRGADIEETDDLGATALMRAADTGDLDLVTLLLDCGADVNNGDWAGATPLSEAAQEGHREVFDLLVARGARRTLLDAASRGEAAVLGSILDAGPDPRIDSAYGYGRKVLLAAVRFGDAATVRLLLDRTAAFEDFERGDDLSPLVAVAEAGNAEVALLLRNLAAMHQASAGLLPPPVLIDAAQRGHLEVVRELLGRGLDPNQRDHAGLTALDWAARNGHEAVVALLEARADR